MIHLSETLTVGSVEGFLTTEEIGDLTGMMNTVVDHSGVERFDTGRTATLHSIPGHTSEQTMAIYEPAGRLEVHDLPEAADALLSAATRRAMPALQRALPSLTACRQWMYVEYGPGQHITAHIDGIAPDPATWPRQIAGISVVLEHAHDGGAFFVETTGAPQLWTGQADIDGYHQPMALAHDGADQSADWFRTLPRTRWHVTPPPGTALLYGSQLTHGTEPVHAGRERKFISWLIAENG